MPVRNGFSLWWCRVLLMLPLLRTIWGNACHDNTFLSTASGGCEPCPSGAKTIAGKNWNVLSCTCPDGYALHYGAESDVLCLPSRHCDGVLDTLTRKCWKLVRMGGSCPNSHPLMNIPSHHAMPWDASGLCQGVVGCEGWGGTLASVSNQRDFGVVAAHQSRAPEGIWVGGYANSESYVVESRFSDPWHWIDGTMFEITDSMWTSGTSKTAGFGLCLVVKNGFFDTRLCASDETEAWAMCSKVVETDFATCGSTCSDGLHNGNETGIDCGGPCEPCVSCFDGIQNQNEEGVDCSGPCSTPCDHEFADVGDLCGEDSGPCASCFDGIQNQGEEGVDCSGPCSAPCDHSYQKLVDPVQVVTVQSNTKYDLGGWKAFDGIGLDGLFFNGHGCTEAHSDPVTWWMVDLRTAMTLSHLKVWNRQDCCADRLGYFNVSISDTPDLDSAHVCYHNTDAAPAAVTLAPCEATGRYVWISVEMSILTLCEVEIYAMVDGTCDNGRQDGGEEGVDCGGACATMCPTCSDGIQNQGEYGIDCGGPCTGKLCSCMNGLQDDGEEGIDCGEACARSCGAVTLLDCAECRVTQSSTSHFGVADFAFDGRGLDGVESKTLSCTHTGWSELSWWMVDLGRRTKLSHLRIWNRQDCCADRLSFFKVSVNDVPHRSTARECYVNTDTVPPPIILAPCEASGQFVWISVERNILSLCEVQVFAFWEPLCENGIQDAGEEGVDCGGPCAAACASCSDGIQNQEELGIDCQGPCAATCAGRIDCSTCEVTQSNTKYGHVASNALDGFGLDGKFFNGYGCTEAHSDPVTWWRVDLGVERPLSFLKVWNVQDSDGMAARLSGFNISVGDMPDLDSAHVCYHNTDAVPAAVTLAPCEATGRYVWISVEMSILSLCEVEIYAFAEQSCSNRILDVGEEGVDCGGVCSALCPRLLDCSDCDVEQSSTDKGGVGSKALDRDGFSGRYEDRGCTHTEESAGALVWWRVDLGRQTNLTKLKIWSSRDECCYDSHTYHNVSVSDEPEYNTSRVCFANANAADYRDTLTVTPCQDRGRYLWIAGEGALILCEVEIYALPEADCSNGLQDPDEAGVDCGGACDAVCQSCENGVQDEGELGLDCGGECADACPSCSDGIVNQGERGTDCGGPCTACPQSCSNGLHDDDEAGVDCGGPCLAPCPTPPPACRLLLECGNCTLFRNPEGRLVRAGECEATCAGLALDNMGITALDDAVFTGMRRVTFVDLSNNQLQNLPPAAFADLSSLVSLDVGDNLLDTSAVWWRSLWDFLGALPNLKHVRAGRGWNVCPDNTFGYGNELQCDSCPAGSTSQEGSNFGIFSCVCASGHALQYDARQEMRCLPSSDCDGVLDELTLKCWKLVQVDQVTCPASHPLMHKPWDASGLCRRVMGCEAWGGGHASVADDRDLSIVEEHWRAFRPVGSGSVEGIWVGGYYEGEWKWVDETTFEYAMDVWSAHSRRDGACVMVSKGLHEPASRFCTEAEGQSSWAMCSKYTTDELPDVTIGSCGGCTFVRTTNGTLVKHGHCSDDCRHLRLRNRGIGSVNSEALSGLNAMQTMDLSNNLLSSFQADVFDGATALLVLELENNRLDLGAFNFKDSDHRLTALTRLSMGGNQLASIPADSFVNLPSLRELRLRSNRLPFLSKGMLSGLHDLLELNVVNNNITFFEPQWYAPLKSLRFLRIAHNPAECRPLAPATLLAADDSYQHLDLCLPRGCSRGHMWRLFANDTDFREMSHSGTAVGAVAQAMSFVRADAATALDDTFVSAGMYVLNDKDEMCFCEELGCVRLATPSTSTHSSRTSDPINSAEPQQGIRPPQVTRCLRQWPRGLSRGRERRRLP